MASEHNKNSIAIPKYNPQLDGLRFCAVLSVVCYHWLPTISDRPVSSFFGGVINFFFVLSSFLITRILFSAKEKSISYNISKYKVILVFLVRRTIRIFPAYYLFLLLVILLPTIGKDVRDHAGMYFSYLANFHIFQCDDYPPVTAHIWTLAVEEQFYLFWPLVIIFIPHRHLLKTFVSIIIGSVILRAIFFEPLAIIPQAILTQYCLDSFAIGGLLAYMYTVSDKERLVINKYFNIVLFAGIPIGVIIILTKSYYPSFVFNRLLFAMISMKVIERAVVGYKSYLGKFLQNKVVLYLGRISYGIYLYHLLVPVIFWRFFDFTFQYLYTQYASFFARHHQGISVFVNILSSETVCFIIYAAFTVIVASLSSIFLEKPISKVKVTYSFDANKVVANPTNLPVVG